MGYLASTVMRNEEEAVQRTKGRYWYGEEVHRGNGLRWLLKMPPISLPVGGFSAHSSSSARRFEDIEAKRRQFAVNARSTPGRVLGNHAEDEFA